MNRMRMKKTTAAIMAIALYASYAYGQHPSAHISWSHDANRVQADKVERQDVDIIKEADLPPGGAKRTYLAEFNYANISMYGVVWAQDSNMAMHIYWTDSDKAYVHNLSTYGDAWVMAFVDGDTLWVPNGQNVMVSDKGTLYQLITGVVNMADNSMEARTGIRFTINADRTELEMEPSPDRNHVLGFYTMNVEGGSIHQAFSRIRMKEFTQEPVSPPEGAEFKRFMYSSMLGGYREWQNGSWMAFDGQDVYVQGLEWIHPEGWVKGAKMSDGAIRIPGGQFVGMNGNYPDFYFAGTYTGDFSDESAEITDRSAFFLNYDEQTGGYYMADNECLLVGKDKYDGYGFPVIQGRFTPFDAKAATPEEPLDLEWDSDKGIFTFRIPMTDTESNPIDRYLLRYSVYINGEKHTFTDSNSPLYNTSTDELEATFSFPIYTIETEYSFGWNADDLYAVIVKNDKPIETLGVRLTYDVLGDVRQSEMAEMRVASAPQIPTDARMPVAFYGLDGCPLTNPSGVCIVRYSDGSVEKVLITNQ